MKNVQLPEPSLVLVPSSDVALIEAHSTAKLPTRSPSQPSDPTDLRSLRIEEFLAARSLSLNSQKAYHADLVRFTTWSNQSWQAATPRLMTQFKTHLMRVDPQTECPGITSHCMAIPDASGSVDPS